MNRLHVHLHVRDLAQSVRFYNALFGAAPAKHEPGYAKWMLEDPRVNFAISTGGEAGLGHLGIQVEDGAALEQATARALAAAGSVMEERGAKCCFAVGDKAWATDPQGVRWETFHTTGDSTIFGVDADETRTRKAEAATDGCCPTAAVAIAPAKIEACCGGTC